MRKTFGTPSGASISGYDKLNNIDAGFQNILQEDGDENIEGEQFNNNIISTPDRYSSAFINSPQLPYQVTSSSGKQWYNNSPIARFQELNHEEENIGTQLTPAENTPLLPPSSSSRRPSALSFEQFNRWRRNVLPNWALSSKADTDVTPNEIEFSVFKAPAGLTPIAKIDNTAPVSKNEFNKIVENALEAIEHGFQPQRIARGSSGSYFVYNSSGQVVGVFKPKDEEPYGPLSPKWTKWMHRTFFPCFFGRSCLIPNLGYISESAASLLDRQLQSYIVPYTDTVMLSSDNFYYSYWDKRANSSNSTPLPKKVGSFQLFLQGYEEASVFFKKHLLPEIQPHSNKRTNLVEPPSNHTGNENDNDDIELNFEWTAEVISQFREELEKLVILDYIMRNTDRGLDNWMIKIEWVTIPEDKILMSPFTAHNPSLKKRFLKKPVLKIGAIDSGLSFPWKHPDEWRSFPFGWLFLPLSLIGQPFSTNTREHYLKVLTSTSWWEETTVLLKEMFMRDSDFKERMWKKQLAVIKGQAFNVVETLKNPNHGPLELTRRTRMMVWNDEMDVPVSVPIQSMSKAIETSIYPSTNSKSVPRSPNKFSSLNSDSPTKTIKHVMSGIKTIPETSEGDTNEDEDEDEVEGNDDTNNLELQDPFIGTDELSILQNRSKIDVRIEPPNDLHSSYDSPATLPISTRLKNISNLDSESQNNTEEPSATINVPQTNMSRKSSTNFNESFIGTESGYDHNNREGAKAKRVIIERLQKVTSKPPVFTWC